MLATLGWHKAVLRAANYAAQQVMALWREMMGGVRRELGWCHTDFIRAENLKVYVETLLSNVIYINVKHKCVF